MTVAGGWERVIGTRVLNKFIFMADPARIDEVRPHVAIALGEHAVLTQAQGNMLEVLPAGTSKGNGLLRLLDDWRIKPSEVMAIGDAENVSCARLQRRADRVLTVCRIWRCWGWSACHALSLMLCRLLRLLPSLPICLVMTRQASPRLLTASYWACSGHARRCLNFGSLSYLMHSKATTLSMRTF